VRRTRAYRFLRRFALVERGVATLEFLLVFPMMMVIMMMGIEIGYATLNYSMLERALDQTVRDIRLGTGTAPQHEAIKDLICVRAGFINDCDATLRLEMIQIDPRNWTSIDMTPDCVDTSEQVAPVRNFVNGLDNELMVLRACAKVTPMFPTTGLGSAMTKDGSGRYALITTSAFVQEPK